MILPGRFKPKEEDDRAAKRGAIQRPGNPSTTSCSKVATVSKNISITVMILIKHGKSTNHPMLPNSHVIFSSSTRNKIAVANIKQYSNGKNNNDQ